MDERLAASLKLCKQKKDSRKKSLYSGFVYVIQCHRFIKVGVARHVRIRLSSLQVGCPYELKLLTFWECDDPGKEEDNIHEFLASFRKRGEWFEVPKEILKHMVKSKSVGELFREV